MPVSKRKSASAVVISRGCVRDIVLGVWGEATGVVDAVRMLVHVNPSRCRSWNCQVGRPTGSFVDCEVVRAAGTTPTPRPDGVGLPGIAFTNVNVSRNTAHPFLPACVPLRLRNQPICRAFIDVLCVREIRGQDRVTTIKQIDRVGVVWTCAPVQPTGNPRPCRRGRGRYKSPMK